jgi:hypothetical protein
MSQTVLPCQVNSGAIYFGSRSEVAQGSKVDIERPSFVPWEVPSAGTVNFHSYKYNLAALNGRWKVYLHVRKDVPSGASVHPVAAFVCPESIEDVYSEAKRIVDTANTIWERDSPACAIQKKLGKAEFLLWVGMIGLRISMHNRKRVSLLEKRCWRAWGNAILDG